LVDFLAIGAAIAVTTTRRLRQYAIVIAAIETRNHMRM
jgi:hypothetical protein